MIKIDVALHENIVSVIDKIEDCSDTVIELTVPENAVLFESLFNLKLIKLFSDSLNKVVNFETNDEDGQNMILSLDENQKSTDYNREEINTNNLETSVKLSSARFPKLKFPKFAFLKKKKLILITIIGGIIVFLLLLAAKASSGMPQANIKIIVNSQPLTRSIQVKVLNSGATNSTEKILQGKTIEAVFEDKITLQTTGEKIIGEKAKGKIVIFNKTDEEKIFKKGTTLVYEDDDKEYEYATLKEIEVPAREEVPDVDPETPADVIITWGESDPVEVEAKIIGKKYNLEKDKNLTIKGQKSSDYEAEVDQEIKGGNEDTVNVVSQTDIDTIKKTLLENSQENAQRAIATATESAQKLINGSTKIDVLKETFSHKLDEETDDLTLTQEFIVKGLTYEPKNLDLLIDILVKDYVTDGYVLSDKERTINVEVLGNTETTVLTESEADIQVTLKTFIITDISEESLKKQLFGKKLNEAEKIIGSIRNIKTYEITLEPNIPFLRFIPKDEERINVVIERE